MVGSWCVLIKRPCCHKSANTSYCRPCKYSLTRLPRKVTVAA